MDPFQIDVNEPSVARRAVWGARWGAALALVFALYAIVLYAVSAASGRQLSPPSLGEVVSIYFAGGVAGGSMVGLVLPLARRKVGSALVGFLAILPVAVLIRVTGYHALAWSGTDSVVVFIGSALIGVPLGVSVHEEIVQPKGTGEVE